MIGLGLMLVLDHSESMIYFLPWLFVMKESPKTEGTFIYYVSTFSDILAKIGFLFTPLFPKSDYVIYGWYLMNCTSRNGVNVTMSLAAIVCHDEVFDYFFFGQSI